MGVIAGCESKPKAWSYHRTIELEGIRPIGLADDADGLWISDGDHKRVVRIDPEGTITETIDSLERPMHIAATGGEILIPLYGNDEILRRSQGQMKALALNDSLDAPAGVWQHEEEIVIADFYNHRILYSPNGTQWQSFGKEGKAKGEFYYPTDVQITDESIWVADAYNNRVQVLDKKGTPVRVIGEAEQINAATGIYVSDTELFVTDFENSRVLIYTHQGELKQELKDSISKPTDMIIRNSELWIGNYGSGSLTVFALESIE